MDKSGAPVLLLVFFGLLAFFITAASIIILSGGKLYQKISPQSRPRRWFVAIWFSYFLVFCLWFAAWYFYPHSIVTRALNFVFGAFTAFFAACYVLGRIRNILSPIIALVERIRD